MNTPSNQSIITFGGGREDQSVELIPYQFISYEQQLVLQGPSLLFFLCVLVNNRTQRERERETLPARNVLCTQ